MSNKNTRNITITPEDVNKNINIETGNSKKSVKINVTIKHIGHKTGEFAVSKIPAVYKRKSKRK